MVACSPPRLAHGFAAARPLPPTKPTSFAESRRRLRERLPPPRHPRTTTTAAAAAAVFPHTSRTSTSTSTSTPNCTPNCLHSVPLKVFDFDEGQEQGENGGRAELQRGGDQEAGPVVVAVDDEAAERCRARP